MRTSLTVATLLAVAGAGTAPAAGPSRDLTTLWIVLPAPALAGVHESVRSGDLVLKQQLVPVGAAHVLQAIDKAGGKYTMTPEADLFLVKADRPVYCVAGIRDAKGALAQFMTGGGSREFCLVDDDADGRFEGYFTPVSMVPGLPTITGNRPRAAEPLPSPVAYEKIDPSSVKTAYWVGVAYLGKPLLYDRQNFGVVFGSDTSKSSFTSFVYTGGGHPAAQSLLGAGWTVEGADGDALRVRIDRPMPMQPFGVLRTVQYHIY